MIQECSCALISEVGVVHRGRGVHRRFDRGSDPCGKGVRGFSDGKRNRRGIKSFERCKESCGKGERECSDENESWKIGYGYCQGGVRKG